MAAVRGEAAEVDEPRVSVGGVYERVCAIVEIEIAKIRKEAEAERARKDEADRKKEDALKEAGDDKALADFRKKKKKEEPDPVISQTPQAAACAVTNHTGSGYPPILRQQGPRSTPASCCAQFLTAP